MLSAKFVAENCVNSISIVKNAKKNVLVYFKQKKNYENFL